jgi:hypothetical protein
MATLASPCDWQDLADVGNVRRSDASAPGRAW